MCLLLLVLFCRYNSDIFSALDYVPDFDVFLLTYVVVVTDVASFYTVASFAPVADVYI